MASSLRTDPRCFCRLVPTDLLVVELREFSRIAAKLGVERNRLAKRCANSSGAISPPCSSLRTT
jgi:hypothetical protein